MVKQADVQMLHQKKSAAARPPFYTVLAGFHREEEGQRL